MAIAQRLWLWFSGLFGGRSVLATKLHIGTWDRLGLAGSVRFIERDFSACYAFACPHVRLLQIDPDQPSCPLGHPIRERQMLRPWQSHFHGDQMAWPNTVVTKAIDCLVGLIVDGTASYSLQPTRMSAGTSATATTDSMVHLVAEVDRVLAGRYRGGQVGAFYKQAIVTGFFGPDDANYNLQEFGLEAGGATDTPGSGFLLARVLSPYGNKDNTKTITVVWTITGSGG